MSSDREDGPSTLTVIPKLVLLTGLSTRTPCNGLIKHQAGTTPNSMLFSGWLLDLNNDLAVGTAKLLSLPTTHQPSSNDCTMLSCSPTFARRSSSGRTGSKSCLTFLTAPMLEGLLEDADITENRFADPPLMLLSMDRRIWEARFESGPFAERANENGLGEKDCGNAPD